MLYVCNVISNEAETKLLNKMANFTKTNNVAIFSSTVTNKKCTVARFVKDGTKRVFFSLEVEGKRITKTMFARQYDANNIARKYCNS
jgi:hypothetical protein